MSEENGDTAALDVERALFVAREHRAIVNFHTRHTMHLSVQYECECGAKFGKARDIFDHSVECRGGSDV